MKECALQWDIMYPHITKLHIKKITTLLLPKTIALTHLVIQTHSTQLSLAEVHHLIRIFHMKCSLKSRTFFKTSTDTKIQLVSRQHLNFGIQICIGKHSIKTHFDYKNHEKKYQISKFKCWREKRWKICVRGASF